MSLSTSVAVLAYRRDERNRVRIPVPSDRGTNMATPEYLYFFSEKLRTAL